MQAYKESVLEPMLQGTEKTPALILDYKEYHTDTTVKFVVRMAEEKLAQAEAAGLHKVFKLQSSLTCNSMVRRRPCCRNKTPYEHSCVLSQSDKDLLLFLQQLQSHERVYLLFV